MNIRCINLRYLYLSSKLCSNSLMIAFASGPPANLASPASVAVHAPLSVKPAKLAPKRDEALRSTIVKVAKYYLWMAQGKSPAEEACSPAAVGAQNAGGDLGMASIPGYPPPR